MGLCASMLRSKARKRYPEPRRGMPTALFVVRDERRPSRPQALVFQAQDSGRPQLRNHGKADTAGRLERCRCWCADALDKLRAQMPGRLPCRDTRSAVAVEPVAPVLKCKTTAAADRGAPPGRSRPPPTTPATPLRPPGTPLSAPMTPMRPVWQRKILMGMRCELPRFSGLILYDEHGQPLPSGSPGRRLYHQGKRKTPRTATTLRDLM